MNWTGGHLQRHSTATASTKNRQKQHFAKIRQNQCHQVQITHPIKSSFSCFDAADCRSTPYLSLAITGSHDALNCSDQSIDKSSRLSSTKLQAKRRQQIFGTEFLLGSSIQKENDGISNVNLPHRIPASNSEVKLSTCKSADKTSSERQNVLGEPVPKKQKILDIPDWIGIGKSKPSPMNCAYSTRINYDDCGFFYDKGQYMPNDYSTASTPKKDFDQKVVNNQPAKDLTSISDYNKLLTEIDSNLKQDRNNQNSIASLKNLPKTSSDYAPIENNNSQWRYLSFPVFNTIHGQSQDYHQFDIKKIEPSFLEKSQAKKHGSRLSFNSSLIRKENNYLKSKINYVSTTEKVLNKKNSQAIPCKASTQPEVFFASSTVCLKHPIPLSSKISCLLKAKLTNEVNKDNEIASLDFGSTKTNLRDKKLTPLSSSLNQKIYGHQKSPNSKDISIQHLSQNKDFCGCNYKIRSEECDQEPDVRNEGVSFKFQLESNLHNSSSKALSETEFIPTSELEPSCNRMTKKVKLKGMQTYQQSNKFSSTHQEGLKANRKDLDEVWKDFVFGAQKFTFWSTEALKRSDR
ncbi:hypothetical protein OnM2_032048 [Erysiphe neolycopersici]|uniref:Uncharacterized protein n=1 Tax=Erysiphe neolycopersici TaxID=212602 RepID=A0A420HYY4_9PEZI|nr:hypothetical protein OnM2_032048 [Erysiphe neolycopersici]